jgi:solute carrier family 25 aspartate/glutamate transporter 12/13
MSSVKETVKESLLGTEYPPMLPAETRKQFETYATHKAPSGEPAMDREDFVNAIAPPLENYKKIQRTQYAVLFDVADRQGTGLVTLKDWATFSSLLSKPDAEYEMAFRVFDVEGKGILKFDDVVEKYYQNKDPNTIPFNWNSEWAELYVGGGKARHDLTYPQFSQMMRALQGEKIRQAFRHFDSNGTGYIEPEQFQQIIVETAGHKVSDYVLENLHTICNIGVGAKISYANVRAFQNVIREMDLIDAVVRSAVMKSKDGKITKADFLNEAARTTRFSLFTPMEADILFHFAGLNNPSDRLSWSEFNRVLDPLWREPQIPSPHVTVGTSTLPSFASISHGEGFFGQVLESAFNFGLGAIAGAFGATVVYPIDLVKTRMQNQRCKVVGEMLYKNSLDCAKKVIRNEGFRGLYSGLGPQLIVSSKTFLLIEHRYTY